MKKKIGLLILCTGTLLSEFFMALTLNFIFEGIQYQYFEVQVILKCMGLVIVGFLIIIFGSLLFQNKRIFKIPEKENWVKKEKGKTYIKMGGNYIVGYNLFSKVLMYLLVLFWIVLWLVLLIGIYLQTGKIEYFYIYLNILFLGLFICVCYFVNRPEIRVNGNQLTIYPRWEKKKVIQLKDITHRKIVRKLTGPIIITYYHDQQELFQIHSGLMNWKRLDMNIYVYLSYKKAQKKDD